MKTRPSILPTRIATLALAVSIASMAQAEGDGVVPTALAVPQIDYGLSDDIDPQVRAEIVNLRGAGLLEFQGQIGSDLIAIDRLQRRAQAIQGLLGALGTDGLRQFDPALYASMENSPIVLRQRIEELKLQRELDEAAAEDGLSPDHDPLEGGGRFGPADPFASSPFLNTPAPEVVVVEEPPVPDFVNDFAEKEPEIVDFPISLREILGANGEFRAVILHGNELIRIEAGDMLPNDTEIIEVMIDRIKIRRRDMTFDIHLRG